MVAWSGAFGVSPVDQPVYSPSASGRATQPAANASVAELVQASKSGDQAAFADLYARFHTAVHAAVFARVSARDADDLVQEVFTEAWAKLASLNEAAAFPGWIMRMARNRAIDHLRRRSPISQEQDVAVDPPPRAEARAALQALRELPETYRETLMMRLVEGLSGPEIAERTGMKPESVRVNLHRGFKLLRQRLGGRR
jgi:RNA polymerase sigma-70 factor (ECF subfamily)